MSSQIRRASSFVYLGTSETDIIVLWDFVKRRGMVRVNTAFIEDGIALEPIHPGLNKFAPGLALVQQKWSKIYFLNERENWRADQYFDLAEQLITERKIKTP